MNTAVAHAQEDGYYDSGYDSGDSYDDYSNYDNSGNSYDDYSGYDDFITADDQYNYSPASYTEKGTANRQRNAELADELDLESFTATETTGNGGYFATKNNGQTQTGRISGREYDASDIPSLDEGQVLVAGATTKVTDQSG